MRFAIPTMNGLLCTHFGHCESFAMVDTDPESKKVLDVKFVTPPPHAPGVLPEWIGQQGASVVLAGGMGARAKDMMVERGITVILGAPEEKPEVVVQAYLEDRLVTGDNGCTH